MQKKLLDRLKSKPETISKHNQALQLLYESGILEFMRLLAVPSYTNASDINSVALSAAEARGFNRALDILFNFDTTFLLDTPVSDRPVPTYGGLELAVKNKVITQGEADDIRAKFHTNARS